MAKDKVIGIEELIQDDHNFNKGTEKGKELIEKSFRELGAGRSVLIDKDNRIIAGNKSQIGAMDAGITKVRVIETDGTELIAVKRTDVSLDSKKGRELALTDNATTEANLSWDKEELEKTKKDFDLNFDEWGLNLSMTNNDINVDEFFENLDNNNLSSKGFKVTIICPLEFETKKNEILSVIKEVMKPYNGVKIG